jgi:hypothetical protein
MEMNKADSPALIGRRITKLSGFIDRENGESLKKVQPGSKNIEITEAAVTPYSIAESVATVCPRKKEDDNETTSRIPTSIARKTLCLLIVSLI